MITGTPPVGPDEIAQAIKSTQMLGLAFKQELLPTEDCAKRRQAG
jgi:hypothetical protein